MLAGHIYIQLSFTLFIKSHIHLRTRTKKKSYIFSHRYLHLILFDRKKKESVFKLLLSRQEDINRG